MEMQNYQTMDPHILYSLVNTRLRNSRRGIRALLADEDIDLADFLAHMAHYGFIYNEETNQFR